MCVDGRGLALGPRSYHCQIALGSRGRLFGSYEVNGRVQHLAQELIRPIALALEVRPMTSGGGFHFGKFGLQNLDLGLQCLHDREVTNR